MQHLFETLAHFQQPQFLFFIMNMHNKASTTKGTLRVGTSNVVVPGNKQSFPVAFQNSTRLTYYSSLFNTVEVNSSFHKILKSSTLQKWMLEVPEKFQFTLKLYKEITHAKALKSDPDLIGRFLKSIEGIGQKKGCLLIQFPGKITLDYFRQVEQILERLNETDSGHEWPKAVEFRSPTWHVGETKDLLQEYGAAMVLHDMPKSKTPDTEIEAPLMYYRFHGPTGNYRGSYSNGFLSQQAEQMRNHLQLGKDVYAYFNNTMGDAFANAITLRVLVENEQ